MSRPAAPTNARWERLNDTDLTLKWDAVPGAVSYGIRWIKGSQTGWDRSQQGWQGIKGTSFTARRFQANSGYRFVVYATNSSGNSPYSNVTPWFYTPPPVPKNLVVTLTVGGPKVTWSRAGSYYTSGSQVQRSSDNEIFTLGNGTGGAAPVEFVDATVAGLGVKYRVRGYVGADSPEGARVFGSWTAWSTPVDRLTPPNAPEIGVGQIVNAVGSSVRFQWVHNPTDGSAQSGAEVRYRVSGSTGAWTVRTVTGAADFYLQSGLAVSVYEFQVRTKGLSGVFGDWSRVAPVRVASLPVMVLASPPVSSSLVAASWSYSQAEGVSQSRAEVRLMQGSRILEIQYVNGSGTIAAFDTILADATTYRLVGWVAAEGLWGVEVSRTFTTAFVKPAAPLVSAVWDDVDGVHRVTVGPGSGGSKATVKLAVQRDTGSGWVTVAEGLPAASTTIVDDGGLTGDNPTKYRALAFTAENAVATAEVSVTAGSGAVWLRSTLGRVAVLYNPSWGYTPSKPNRKLIHFDGESVPTVFEDSATERSLSVSGTLLPSRLEDAKADLPTVRANLDTLLTSPGLIRVSTPDGIILTGVLTSVNVNTEVAGVGRVSLSVEEAQ